MALVEQKLDPQHIDDIRITVVKKVAGLNLGSRMKSQRTLH